MDMDAALVAIALHRFPVFGDFGFGFRQLIPGDGFPPGRELNHHRCSFQRGIRCSRAGSRRSPLHAHAAEGASERLRTCHSTTLHKSTELLLAVRRNEIDALMGGIVAGHVTQVAFDAAGGIDARHGPERKIEVFEIRNAVDDFCRASLRWPRILSNPSSWKGRRRGLQ